MHMKTAKYYIMHMHSHVLSIMHMHSSRIFPRVKRVHCSSHEGVGRQKGGEMRNYLSDQGRLGIPREKCNVLDMFSSCVLEVSV